MTNPQFAYLLPTQSLQSIKIKENDIIDYSNGKKCRKIYENVEYDQQQMKQIQQFKKYAQTKMNLSETDDKTILRYLYSTDFNLQECVDKIKLYLDWYSDPKIQRFDNKTLDLINQGVVYTYGRDKQKRPIIYVNVALMDMTKYTLEDYLSAINAIVTLVIDYLFIKGKLENYCFIIDTGNKNFSSLPLSTVKQMVLKLSYVYSMRMGKLLVINCNYLIKLMYSGVSPFLADVTKQKIKLLSTSEVQNGKMREYINANELQQNYGGSKQNLIVKWPPVLAGKQEKTQKTSRQNNVDSTTSNQLDQTSEYYSVINNEEMFERYGQSVTVNTECCSGQQCEIF